MRFGRVVLADYWFGLWFEDLMLEMVEVLKEKIVEIFWFENLV